MRYWKHEDEHAEGASIEVHAYDECEVTQLFGAYLELEVGDGFKSVDMSAMILARLGARAYKTLRDGFLEELDYVEIDRGEFERIAEAQG